MSQTITIDPVTRIEGHSKITIQLDDRGEVVDAHVQLALERRGSGQGAGQATEPVDPALQPEARDVERLARGQAANFDDQGHVSGHGLRW